MDLTLEDKKECFINLLLPSILMVREKLNENVKKIVKISQKLEFGIKLSEEEKNFLNQKLEEYNIKEKNIPNLLIRMKPHPTSVVLAQAIIETGWGTSNFFKKGNNIFGMWSFNKNEARIQAGELRGEKAIYLKKYDSLYDSIEDYFYRIATVKAYENFREKRFETDNSLELVKELILYSELREEYVKRLQNIIEYNKLYKYDEYELKEN